ncbi:unnamed protein product [Meloidogyne enterolobii]|uniref:Uncharacterized protein n=1 Tax=Meloidogyne enterolobii TaxID=390850 RepID=A0ACB0YQV2_MELEN
MRISKTIKTGYFSNVTTSAQINQQLQRRCCSTSLLPLLSSTSLLFNKSPAATVVYVAAAQHHQSQCQSEVSWNFFRFCLISKSIGVYFSGSVSEINVDVKRKQYDPRIEFVERSRPPKVKKVGYNSYLNGILYVGDEVIGLNDEEIRTADDFNRIACARSTEPVRLRIRVRRDCYYKITIKRVEGEQGNGEVLDLEIKWRRGGMPLGVSMEESRVSRSGLV